ncbi:hypothetical protein [Streptomyces subrutilus]|uniref:Uncharacterized protein n=1 Tax=Streptomyces subrutilus TaxID=36818 RepID=A0A1E5NXP4_9ACTN|nr:hypothetical protein [Streptomyces subrutilus]OEJ21036.1 hypothetical protein BGK67_34635 [Streptomyces subrutilus]
MTDVTATPTAAQELTAALAAWGIRAHFDSDHRMGTSWLIIGADQDSTEFPDMDERDYVRAYASTPDTENEMFVDEPMGAATEWHTILGSGLEATDAFGHLGEVHGPHFTNAAAVAEYVADWYTDRAVVRLSAELAALLGVSPNRADVEELAFLRFLLAACKS